MKLKEPAQAAAMLVESVEKFRELEDEEVQDSITKHNHFLRLIQPLETKMNSDIPMGTMELAQMEYLYGKAHWYAWRIASHYRMKRDRYLAAADIERANLFERVYKGTYDPKIKGSTAGAEIARKAKGEMEMDAAPFAGAYEKWRGAAGAYELMINSLKDMIKRSHAELSGGV